MKGILEKSICDMIAAFEDKTGVKVEDVHYERMVEEFADGYFKTENRKVLTDIRL